MPFWVFDVRLRNRALLNNNLKIIFEVSKNWEMSPKKKMKLLAQNICLEKKGRRLPNSPKWRPKRPITLRCEKMPKKARGEVLSLIILIRPRTFWSSHAALLFQNYQSFLHKFDIGALQKQYLHVLMRIGKNGYSNHMDLRPAYVRFFHLSTIINLVFNQRFRVMVRKRKKIQPFEKSSSIILTSTHDLSFSYLLQIVQFSQPFI